MGIDITTSARLSSLNLTDEEIDHFSLQFSEIFAWIERIEALDLRMKDDSRRGTPLRQDIALNELFNRLEMLLNAPEHNSSYFQAPGMLKQ